MKSMRRSWGNQEGFTLAELMIAFLVITLVIVGYVGATTIAQKNSEEMHERTIAIQNANQVIEQIRTVSNTNPFPGSVIAAYPDNSHPAGFNDLPNEMITVSYSDTTENPLIVTVTVAWQSYARRPYTEAVQTYITKRG